MSNEIEKLHSGNARFEKNQLVISDHTSLKEWKDLGYYLSRLQGNVQFWIGDWVKFGTKKGFYVDSAVYDELEKITGLDRVTLKHYKSVADNVSAGTRLPELSYTHHREVANMNPIEQSYFLNKALQEKLSVRELRYQIACKNPPDSVGNILFYNNNSPFPIRLGEWHLPLQKEAFEMETTIHMRVLCIIKGYFENKLAIIEIK